MKRQREEDSSSFCNPKRRRGEPIILTNDNSQYMIMNLIGKGGYSEVYRAFDLTKYQEVACKIHHFDKHWSEAAK